MDEFLNEEMPAEDYLIQQLKDTVERRRASMGRIKDAYANDPRSRMTPLDVGIQNFVGQPGLNGFGIPSYAPLMEGMANQRELLLQNKIQPELLQQKFDETDPFEQLYRKVVTKRDEKNGGWQLTNSADGGIQRTHVATGKVEHLMSGTLYAKQKEALSARFLTPSPKLRDGPTVPEEVQMPSGVSSGEIAIPILKLRGEPPA